MKVIKDIGSSCSNCGGVNTYSVPLNMLNCYFRISVCFDCKDLNIFNEE
jgi:hypothetical protein